MSAKRRLMTAESPMHHRGSAVRGSTWASKRDPGSPFSLANAQAIREAVARYPTFEMTMAATITDTCVRSISEGSEVGIMRTPTITDVPALLLAAFWNTAIKGKCVGVWVTAFSSPKQNKVAISIANPRTPLIPTDAIILRGMTVDADSISSANT